MTPAAGIVMFSATSLYSPWCSIMHAGILTGCLVDVRRKAGDHRRSLGPFNLGPVLVTGLLIVALTFVLACSVSFRLIFASSPSSPSLLPSTVPLRRSTR